MLDLDMDKYEELNLIEKKEYIEKLLNNEFELGEDFDGKMSHKVTVTHKECGVSQNIRLTGLLLKKNICDHCFDLKKINEFKEKISSQLELVGKYVNGETPVKVKIKRCNHTKMVKPNVVLKSIKKNKVIKCDKCVYEQKKASLEKRIEECCSYEGEYTLYSLDEKPNTPIGVKHNKCGTVEYYNYKQILMKYVNCKECKNKKSKDWFNYKLKHKYKISDEYKLASKYVSTSKPVVLEHKCGCKRYVLPSTLEVKPNINCRWCNSKDFFNSAEVKVFLFYKTKGEYQLLNEYNPNDKLMYLKKKSCQHKFTVNSNKFFDDIHCPVCKKKALLEKKHKIFVQQMNEKYEGKYQVLSRYKNNKHLVDLVHLECGRIICERPKILLANNIKEPCQKCKEKKDLERRKNKFIERLNNKFDGKVLLLDEFKTQREDHTFKCLETGETFIDKPYLLIKRKTPYVPSVSQDNNLEVSEDII